MERLHNSAKVRRALVAMDRYLRMAGDEAEPLGRCSDAIWEARCELSGLTDALYERLHPRDQANEAIMAIGK